MLLVAGSSAFWVLVIVGAVNEDDTLVGIALGVGLVVAVCAETVAIRRSNHRRGERTRIVDQGVRSPAHVVSAKSNGALNNNPYVDFVLEVQPEGEEPYRVEHRTLVSQMAIPRVQPGAVIDVYVDPGDPQSVVIEPSVIT